MNYKTHLYFFFSSLLILLYGCDPLTVNVRHENQKPRYQISSDDEVEFSLAGKTVALFPIYTIEEVSVQYIEMINKILLEKTTNSSLFQKVILPQEIENKLKQNTVIQQKKIIYFDTFYKVSVSDKELSNQIASYIKAEVFLIFQISFWPCKACIPDNLLRLKYQMVDGISGKIVWTGVHEKYDLQDTESSFKQTLLKMTYEMIHALEEEFKD